MSKYFYFIRSKDCTVVAIDQIVSAYKAGGLVIEVLLKSAQIGCAINYSSCKDRDADFADLLTVLHDNNGGNGQGAFLNMTLDDAPEPEPSKAGDWYTTLTRNLWGE